jgi:predicted DNA-binding transcriptional regulator YafY
VIRYLEDPASGSGSARKAAPADPSPQTAAPSAPGLSGSEIYHIDHGPFAEADPNPGILKLLETAVSDRTAIKVSYSGYAKDAEEFLFFPYILALRVGTLYLIGRQGENRGPFKSLSVRRIRRCIATRDAFKPDAFRAEDYYKYTFGQWHRQLHEEPETVLLLLKAPWLEKYLGESRFNPPGRILRKAGETLFELKVVIKPDFVNWVLSLTPDLLPLKPDSLRSQVADRLAKASADLAKL